MTYKLLKIERSKSNTENALTAYIQLPCRLRIVTEYFYPDKILSTIEVNSFVSTYFAIDAAIPQEFIRGLQDFLDDTEKSVFNLMDILHFEKF